VVPSLKSYAQDEGYGRYTGDGEGENVAVEVVGEWDWTDAWATGSAETSPNVKDECIHKEKDSFHDAYD
jgi:hypothetical protein